MSDTGLPINLTAKYNSLFNKDIGRRKQRKWTYTVLRINEK